MRIATGGNNIYGYDVGIIMLDTVFPRIPGDIGNVNSFNYPVLYEKVENWKPNRVVCDLNREDIEPFIDTAKKLDKAGCKIISTSCGFLSLFQKEIADSVNASVFTSALLVAPMIKRTMSSKKKVCVLTANQRTLTDYHLKSVGINRDDYIIYGLEDEKTFTNYTVENWISVNVDDCRKDIMRVVRRAMKENDNIGAFVLECTNMPPFSEVIQKEVNLPVYDIISLLNFARDSIKKRSFERD